MIDTKQGILTLCASGFQITADTTPQDLSEKIPELILRADPILTGYTHFYCWLDVEPQRYVWASICFCGNVLESIRLFPQHQSTSIPAPQPSSMDIEESHPLAHTWYSKHFEQDRLTFPRGSVQYCPGSDPIYSPTSVLIRYTRK